MSGTDSDEYTISLPLQEMAAQHSMNTLYDFTVALERSYRFPFDGRADFALSRHFGKGQVFVDDKLLISGASEQASLQVRKDQSYKIKVVYANLNFDPAVTGLGQQPTRFEFSIKEEILATRN